MNVKVALPMLFLGVLSKYYQASDSQNKNGFNRAGADKVFNSHSSSNKYNNAYVSIDINPAKTDSYDDPASNKADNDDDSVDVFEPESVSKEIKELKKWSDKNITVIVGTPTIESDKIPEFTKKVKLLIGVDDTIHKMELSEGQDYRNWEDYMRHVYQPLFSRYRDVIFKMEKEQIKEMLKLEDTPTATNKESASRKKNKARAGGSKVNRSSIGNSYIPLMLDRFYFSSPSAFDLTANVTNLFLAIVGSEALSKDETTELKRRFVMTQFEDNDRGASNNDTLEGRRLSRSEIKEIREEFDLSSVMDSLKEYFDFMKRLGKIVNTGKELYFAYPKLSIDNFEESEKDILVECSDIFKGYLHNVKGVKRWLESEERH